MLRKIAIAGAAVAAVAGMGLVTPAYADDELVDVTCVGPTFGEKENTLTKGSDLLSGIALVGDSEKDLMHSQDSTEFKYSCGNGPIAHVGNTSILIDKGHKGYQGNRGWRD